MFVVFDVAWEGFATVECARPYLLNMADISPSQGIFPQKTHTVWSDYIAGSASTPACEKTTPAFPGHAYDGRSARSLRPSLKPTLPKRSQSLSRPHPSSSAVLFCDYSSVVLVRGSREHEHDYDYVYDYESRALLRA